ncbi:MAG TPA: hypothetical protein VML75_03535 [Kofleriaceae bacterium]|nr:hypothetical protein [Kofleriaceae bacterium]
MTGKICAPPSLAPAVVQASLDEAMKARPEASLYAPSLCRAAGDDARAAVAERRLGMLESA